MKIKKENNEKLKMETKKSFFFSPTEVEIRKITETKFKNIMKQNSP